MTVFDEAWDVAKAPIVSDNRTSYDFDFIDVSNPPPPEGIEHPVRPDEGDDACCAQFRPALERYPMFKGKSCSEMYDRLTEIIDLMYRKPQLISGNVFGPEWCRLLPEIKRQWDECRAKNYGLGGKE